MAALSSPSPPTALSALYDRFTISLRHGVESGNTLKLLRKTRSFVAGGAAIRAGWEPKTG
jgi:hypothetical protein